VPAKKPFPVYDRSMGYVEYEPAQTVIIAGRPRHQIIYCNAAVEQAYIHEDRINDSLRKKREERATAGTTAMEVFGQQSAKVKA